MYGTGVPARPTAEPIFPPELRRRAAAELTLPGPLATWHRCLPPPPPLSRRPRGLPIPVRLAFVHSHAQAGLRNGTDTNLEVAPNVWPRKLEAHRHCSQVGCRAFCMGGSLVWLGSVFVHGQVGLLSISEAV